MVGVDKLVCFGLVLLCFGIIAVGVESSVTDNRQRAIRIWVINIVVVVSIIDEELEFVWSLRSGRDVIIVIIWAGFVITGVDPTIHH